MTETVIKRPVAWRRNDLSMLATEVSAEEDALDKQWADMMAQLRTAYDKWVTLPQTDVVPNGSPIISVEGGGVGLVFPDGSERPSLLVEAQLRADASICSWDTEEGRINPLALSKEELLRFREHVPAVTGLRDTFCALHPATDFMLDDAPAMLELVQKQFASTNGEVRLRTLTPGWCRRYTSEPTPGTYGIRVVRTHELRGNVYLTYDGPAWLAHIEIFRTPTDVPFQPSWVIVDCGLNFIVSQYCMYEQRDTTHHVNGRDARYTLLSWALGPARLKADVGKRPTATSPRRVRGLVTPKQEAGEAMFLGFFDVLEPAEAVRFSDVFAAAFREWRAKGTGTRRDHDPDSIWVYLQGAGHYTGLDVVDRDTHPVHAWLTWRNKEGSRSGAFQPMTLAATELVPDRNLKNTVSTSAAFGGHLCLRKEDLGEELFNKIIAFLNTYVASTLKGGA